MNIVMFQTKYDRTCFSSADVVCEYFHSSPVDNMTRPKMWSPDLASNLIWADTILVDVVHDVLVYSVTE